MGEKGDDTELYDPALYVSLRATRTIDQLRKKELKSVSQYWNRKAEKVSYDEIDPVIMRFITGRNTQKVMHSMF